MKDIEAKTAAIAIIAAIALILGIIAFSAWRAGRTAGAEHRVESAQAGATVNSARDAIVTEGNVSAAAAASEDLTARNAKDIAAANGSDQAVNPEVREAGLAALCRRPAYRDAPRCSRGR